MAVNANTQTVSAQSQEKQNMQESQTMPPQLRAARLGKQRIVKTIILTVTLLFLFVPLVSMFLFTIRHPLSGKWSFDPWIAIFTGDGSALGADLSTLWSGLGASLALCVVTVLIMLVLLVPTMVIVHIRSRRLERAHDDDDRRGEQEARGVGEERDGHGDGAEFPHMTALQNVEFGLEIRGVDRVGRRRQAMEKLELVGLADQAKKYTQQMSGGRQQRVALARALAVNPRVLLLDEPLSALDAKVRVLLRDEIRRIQLEAGTTTVFVTHDQEEALAVADRIGVMNHGRIEQIADPQTLYRRPGTEYVATFIGLTNRLPGIANGEEAVVFGQRVPLLDGSATDASTVLVSPENMTIELTNDADAVHRAGELGRVEMVHFLGALARVDVRVACAGMGGTNSRHRAAAGQRAARRTCDRSAGRGRASADSGARRLTIGCCARSPCVIIAYGRPSRETSHSQG